MAEDSVEAKKERILDFLIRYKKSLDGNSPTVREIMAGARISSTSLVASYLRLLQEDGKIRLIEGDGRVRGIIVNGGCWQYGGGNGKQNRN